MNPQSQATMLPFSILTILPTAIINLVELEVVPVTVIAWYTIGATPHIAASMTTIVAKLTRTSSRLAKWHLMHEADVAEVSANIIIDRDHMWCLIKYTC